MKNKTMKTIGVIWLIIFTGLIVYYYFKESNKPLLSPAVLNPVSTVYANEIPKEQTRWYRLYKKVRWLESNNGTKGLAITCLKKGMVNSIGYLPVKGYCFDSQEQEEITFAKWINKHIGIEGMTEAQALNHYSNNAY
jgi:hypothetical protein